jgi:hypothetical protein
MNWKYDAKMKIFIQLFIRNSTKKSPWWHKIPQDTRYNIKCKLTWYYNLQQDKSRPTSTERGRYRRVDHNLSIPTQFQTTSWPHLLNNNQLTNNPNNDISVQYNVTPIGSKRPLYTFVRGYLLLFWARNITRTTPEFNICIIIYMHVRRVIERFGLM